MLLVALKTRGIYVGLQSAMGTLKCDGRAKVRWFALKCDDMMG